jgi:hypothetical protein
MAGMTADWQSLAPPRSSSRPTVSTNTSIMRTGMLSSSRRLGNSAQPGDGAGSCNHRGYGDPNYTPTYLSPLRRQNPKEEPDALAAHVGICAGVLMLESRATIPKHQAPALQHNWRKHFPALFARNKSREARLPRQSVH